MGVAQVKALTLRLPIKTESLNTAQHWRTKARRVQRERGATAAVVRVAPKPKLPVSVTLTRISPRELDSDNAVGALKHVRDGVADAYDVDDRGPHIRWVYEQRKGAAKEYAVEIRIEERGST